MRGRVTPQKLSRGIRLALLAFPLATVAGFWVPYFSQIPTFEASITTAVHLHAVLLFTWVLLLAVQPLAIRNNAYALHRTLGKATYFLMPLIVLSAITMLVKEYHEHVAAGMSRSGSLTAEYLSSVQLLLFAWFYALAIVRIKRRDVTGHMQYITCVALVLFQAAMARILGYGFEVGQRTSQTVCLITIDLCLAWLLLQHRKTFQNGRPFALAALLYGCVEVTWVLLGRPV